MAAAALVFVLAAAGFVVAFFVFAILFVVFGLAIRRARKTVRYGEDGSRFIIYTNIPGADGGGDPTSGPPIPIPMNCPRTTTPWSRLSGQAFRSEVP
ncbi:MAG: hypothetical protein V8Q84_07760 [Bilophila sp.]